MHRPEVIYIVDDDEGFARGLARLVAAAGWAPEIFASAEAFLARARSDAACVILDVFMPPMNGPELLRALRERAIDLPVVFLSGHRDAPSSLVELGGVALLEKPVGAEALFGAIRDAIARRPAA